MKRFIKVLSVLLAIIMVVGLLPLSVFAEDIQKTHTVKFNLNYNGAHSIPSQKVADGECATQPENVTREGWIFQYWYKRTDNGSEKFDLSQPITADVTLYAYWDEDPIYWGPIWDRNIHNAIEAGKDHEEAGNTYTVTFEANGDGVVGMPENQKVKTGECAIEPVAPTRSGYIFSGWYIDAEGTISYDFATAVTADITLYAKWNITAEKYYKENSELIEIIKAEESVDTPNETEVVTLLEKLGFNDYPVTYDYSIHGDYEGETEIQDASLEKHPMYQTYYMSKNREAWVIYVINGEIFANPLYFNLQSDLKAPLLIATSEILTSYDDESNKFYVTIPNDSELIIKIVEKIDSKTLDKITIEELCGMTGATPPVSDSEVNDGSDNVVEHSIINSTTYTSESTNTVNSSSDPIVVVSLGDSYSSGEGIEKFYGQDKPLVDKVKDENWLAHRSTKSWPSLLKIPGVDGIMADYWVQLKETSNNDVQWYFGAASGAKTNHFNYEHNKYYKKKTGKFNDQLIDVVYLPPQLKIFDNIDADVDIVTLTVGGNDLGFSDIINIAAKRNKYLIFGENNELKEKLAFIWSLIEEKMVKIEKVYNAISELTGDQAAIIVVGYPQLIDLRGSGLLFTHEEAYDIAIKTIDFNNKIIDVVNNCRKSGKNIHYVSVLDEFEGHQAYAGNNEWIRRVLPWQDEELDDDQLISDYSIHPNEEGAKAYARCVNAKIKEIWTSDVTGTISDLHGPISNAIVTISNLERSKSVQTDKNGKFIIENVPRGTYDITVIADGYETKKIDEMVTVHGIIDKNTIEGIVDVGNIKFVSPFATCKITGKVTIADADTNILNNIPLEGASVYVEITGYMGTEEFSNSNGEYTLKDIPTGTYTITVSKEGFIPATEVIEVDGEEEIIQNITIELIPQKYEGTGFASGTIYDSVTGLPVSGLTLYIRKGLENITGDVFQIAHMNESSSYITIGLPAGNYTVQVVDERTGISDEERYMTSYFNIKVFGGMTIGNQNGYVCNNVKPEDPSTAFSIKHGDTDILNSKQPIEMYNGISHQTWTITSNVPWKIVINRGDWFSLSVDGKSVGLNSTFDAGKTELKLSINKSTDSRNDGTIAFAVGGETYTVEICQIACAVSGTITMIDGKTPIANAKVTVSNANYTSQPVATSTDGRFKIAIPNGYYDITIEADGYETTTFKSYFEMKGKDVEIGVIKLNSYNITGVILDAATGLPLEGVSVEWDKYNNVKNVVDTTDNEGRYQFMGELASLMGTTRTVVRFRKDGYTDYCTLVEIKKDTVTIVDTISMELQNPDLTYTKYAMGQCGDSLFWTIDNLSDFGYGGIYKTVRITGSGELWDNCGDMWSLYEDVDDNIMGIKSITIPEGVTVLGNYLLTSMYSVDVLSLPASITGFNKYTFSGSSHLGYILIDENNPYYTSIDGILYSKDKTELLVVPSGLQTRYVNDEIDSDMIILDYYVNQFNIPDYVNIIGAHAFAENWTIDIITIPDSVTEIQEWAFSESNIVSICLPDSIQQIGDQAFFGCNNLINAELPSEYHHDDSLNQVFAFCTSLERIVIPSKIDRLSYTFDGCSSLKSVYFTGDAPKRLYSDTFDGCHEDLTLYYLEGKTGWTSPTWTSYDGVSFKTATYTEDDLITYTISSGTCGDNITWSFDNTGLLRIDGTGNMTDYSYNHGSCQLSPWGPCMYLIKKVEISDGVTSIGSHAFDDCYNLESIDIPETVTHIGENAFYGCSALQKVTIPSGIEVLSDYVFANCRALQNITIPNTVTDIGEYAFSYCTNLNTVNFSKELINIGDDAFTCCYQLKKVKLPDSVVSIGNGAFGSCLALSSVELSSNLTNIGNYAFNRTVIEKITISENVSSIGDYAFSNEVLTKAYFKGDSPLLGKQSFRKDLVTLYYIEGKADWTSPTWTAPDGTVYNTATWEP